MNRFCLMTVFLFAIAMASDVFAQIQIQKGVARKITRSASDPFVPVPGVQVVVGEQANKASDKDGRFSLAVKITDKIGSYALTAVRMPQGSTYMLASPLRGKQLFVSANDLEISLITPEEKDLEYKKQYNALKEKYETQSLFLCKLRNELNKHLAELSESDMRYVKLKAEGDSVRKLYLDYINNEDRIDEVIKQLAEELALTDYQSLDSLELKIYELKSSGQWKALNDLIRESMPGGAEEALKSIEQQSKDTNSKVAQAKFELASGLSEQQRLIQLRSQWFKKMETAIEAFVMQHLNDSVSFYYGILTKADSTNWRYLNAAGLFECEYMTDYNRAMNYHLSALNIADSDTLKSVSYNNIGIICECQANYVKALEYYEKSLEIHLSVCGENHPQVATSYNNIGAIYKDKGNSTIALDYLVKALKIYLFVYGENHPYIAISYNNIGNVYSDQGENSKALEYCIKALRIRLSVYGENHSAVAESYNNIGYMYSVQGDYAKAMDYYEKSLKINLIVYGENHPIVAMSYNNIGSISQDQGEKSKALDYYLRALKIRLSVYGENHPDIAVSYNNIGSVYSDQGDKSKALEYYVKALNMRLSVYGENHPDVASSYNNIGMIYYAQKDDGKALICFEKALTSLSVNSMNQPQAATSYYNIGVIYYNREDYTNALIYFEKSLAVDRKIFGENHDSIKVILWLIKDAANRRAQQAHDMQK